MILRRKSEGFLILEDGTSFPAEEFWGHDPKIGEAVFNTSHSGYQEILTDPSYREQIMVFTAPHIGNVGVNDEDMESGKVQVTGAIVRSLSPRPSSWRSQKSLPEWMDQADRPMLTGVDTRSVTFHLREAGAMRAGMFPSDVDQKDALDQVLASPSMEGADLATTAGCSQPYDFTEKDVLNRFRPTDKISSDLRVAVLDLGVKRAILEELARRGCQVRVLPALTPFEQIRDGGFHGVLISNGPGDPAAAKEPVKTVTAILEWAKSSSTPIFGICMGHQLLSLAAGMETFKLRFGHRGSNHPVRRESDKQVEITSQNHGFAVKPEGLADDFEISHINLNDKTVEGLVHKENPIFSIQYHPEASPGPLDGLNYFDRFLQNMQQFKG